MITRMLCPVAKRHMSVPISAKITCAVRCDTPGKRRSETAQLSERELVQSRLGSIVARLGASRAHLREVMTNLLAAIEGGGRHQLGLDPSATTF